MARATNSLPVPLSPVIRTVLVVGATVRTISRMALNLPALADNVVVRKDAQQFAAQAHILFTQRQLLAAPG